MRVHPWLNDAFDHKPKQTKNSLFADRSWRSVGGLSRQSWGWSEWSLCLLPSEEGQHRAPGLVLFFGWHVGKSASFGKLARTMWATEDLWEICRLRPWALWSWDAGHGEAKREWTTVKKDKPVNESFMSGAYSQIPQPSRFLTEMHSGTNCRKALINWMTILKQEWWKIDQRRDKPKERRETRGAHDKNVYKTLDSTWKQSDDTSNTAVRPCQYPVRPIYDDVSSSSIFSIMLHVA